MSGKHTSLRVILTAILLFALALIAFLEGSKAVAISWTIIGIGTCYALWHVAKQSRIWWLGRNSRVAQRERFLKLLISLMGFFFATGTALFLFSFQCEAELANEERFTFVNAEYLLHSMICSLDLFMLDIDSSLLDNIGEHAYLKGLISIQAVFSFACTVALLIGLAYVRAIAYIKLHRMTAVNYRHNHLYLFFGLNTPSYQLIKSIKEKEGEQAVVIIVENWKNSDDDRDSWDSIIGLVSNRKQALASAEELNARITFTESQLCNIDPEQVHGSDIFGEMNLRKLRSLVQNLANVADAELHIFFLSENEDENIRSLSILALDENINKANEKIKCRFYCHARLNGLNRVAEDIVAKRGLDVHIVDSSHLAVELLKINDLYHPVRVVGIDKTNPTTVNTEFHSLIIGFDEVGQDALRFLYEFGAFVDSSSTTENVKRIPFHCTAIDTKMSEKEGVFRAFTPAIMKQNENVKIELKECDCQSREFYEDILTSNPEQLKKLNYVVIAAGKDEMGMLCAIRIFNHVRRYREDLSRFRIFVRSYQPDKESYMQKIANHYNEGYNNDCKENAFKTEAIIIPFGQSEKIYSYDMIVSEELTAIGKRFLEAYARMKGETELWDTRRAVLTGVKKYEKNSHGEKTVVDVPPNERKVSLDNIHSLRRKEAQNISNALHAGTKLYLLRQTQNETYDWEDFLHRYFNADGKPYCEGRCESITYPGLTPEENRIIFNLAGLEHLRWNASHEILGYERAKKDVHKCVERTKEHNCLCSWKELDAESDIVTETEHWEADYKLFDFGVVDNTLALYKNKLLASQTQNEKK